MHAHYFATRTVKYVLITKSMQPFSEGSIRIEVKGKAEARKVAASYNAICWNF